MGMISRNGVRKGDHIYTWRTGYIYSHHGIYIGEDTVIHFTSQVGTETKTGSFFHKIITSSSPNHHKNPCLKCGNKSNPNSSSKNVVSSCLDCFLGGGNLYLFEYNVSEDEFLGRPRGGTCTTAFSDSPQQVVYRAKYLLTHNGFGDYSLFKNNCEDFAVYCKTSLVVRNRNVMGGSGQVSSAVGGVLRFLSLYAFEAGSEIGSEVRSVISNVVRLVTNIGTRKDVVRVSVKSLVHQMNVN